jgi:hypothetical protein
MDELSVQHESNKVTGTAMDASSVAGFWFYFSYYAPPALLVERELHMR